MYKALRIALARRGILSAALLAYIWYYYTYAVQRARLICKPSDLSKYILSKCRRLVQPYSPTCWAPNAHQQTALAILRKHTVRAGFSRQLLSGRDGGTVGLDWFQGCQQDRGLPASTPILLVLHGLAGSSEDGYAKHAAAAAARRAWRAAVLNYRGAGGTVLTTPAVTSAATTEDVALALSVIGAQFPGAPLLAVGYSMGGLILTKFLGELGLGRWEPATGARLAAAMVVSSPFCPASSNARLSRAWTLPWVYNVALTRLFIRRFCAEHAAALGQHPALDLPKLMQAGTMHGFVENVVCVLAAHASADQYYAAAPARRHIPAIATPTLFLASADDPFLGAVPAAEIEANPHTLLALTARGGHCGFLQGLWPFGTAWSDEVMAEFFACMLAHEGAAAALQACKAAAAPSGAAADCSKSRSYADFMHLSSAKGAQQPGVLSPAASPKAESKAGSPRIHAISCSSTRRCMSASTLCPPAAGSQD